MTRDYTLLDNSNQHHRLHDPDLVVRFMEYVRQNFRTILPDVPAGCEFDLLASGTAHNPGLVPLLAFYTPPDFIQEVPNPLELNDRVWKWCAALSDEEVRSIAESTDAPTWAELQTMRVYPRR